MIFGNEIGDGLFLWIESDRRIDHRLRVVIGLAAWDQHLACSVSWLLLDPPANLSVWPETPEKKGTAFARKVARIFRSLRMLARRTAMATAAPPSSVMNSRRFIRSPRRRGRALSSAR